MSAIDCLTRFSLLLLVSLTLYTPGEAVDRAVTLLVDVSRPSPQQTVNVTCSFDPKLSSMSSVESLKFYSSKPGSKKSDLQLSASVDRWNTGPRLFGSLNDGSAYISGFFGAKDSQSELTLSWTLLAQTAVNRFKCGAEGTDHSGQRVTVTELVEMTRTEPQLEQVCYASNLDLLVDKIDVLTETSANISAIE